MSNEDYYVKLKKSDSLKISVEITFSNSIRILRYWALAWVFVQSCVVFTSLFSVALLFSNTVMAICIGTPAIVLLWLSYELIKQNEAIWIKLCHIVMRGKND